MTSVLIFWVGPSLASIHYHICLILIFESGQTLSKFLQLIVNEWLCLEAVRWDIRGDAESKSQAAFIIIVIMIINIYQCRRGVVVTGWTAGPCQYLLSLTRDCNREAMGIVSGGCCQDIGGRQGNNLESSSSSHPT